MLVAKRNFVTVYLVWMRRTIMHGLIGTVITFQIAVHFTNVYSQWAVKTFSMWGGELEVIDSLLKEDVRNNSAWNHVSAS
jgi:hypothetical protein